MNVVWRRISYALWGIPLIALVTYIGGWLFVLFVAFICGYAQWEYYRLHQVKGISANVGLIFGTLLPVVAHLDIDFLLEWVLLGSLMPAIVLPLEKPENAQRRVGAAVSGVIYPSLMLSLLVPLRDVPWDRNITGGLVLFFIITGVWICDTAAYFGGKSIGIRKLAPSISPNKTLEGAIFGLLGAIGWGILVYIIYPGELPLQFFIATGFIVGVAGQIGDLSESAIKRSAGVKDSGSVLGPHGGMLDRFDSIIAVAPVVYIYFKIIGLL